MVDIEEEIRSLQLDSAGKSKREFELFVLVKINDYDGCAMVSF